MPIYDKLTMKNVIKLDNSRSQVKVKCKNCGHSMVIVNVDRTICSHCGFWIYRTPEIEFKYKIKQEMIKNDRRTKDSIYNMEKRK